MTPTSSFRSTYRFGDLAHFACDFGHEMEGSPSLLCTSAGEWNGTVPKCNCKWWTQLQ